MMEVTNCDDVAKERLQLILSDKLLRFNPYRVTDETLVECAYRGQWLPWPSITQMLIFHFKDIKLVHEGETYYALFFKVGNASETYHYSVNTFSRPLTHLVSKQPVWMTLNNRHITPSSIEKLVNRDIFVSHALNCRKASGKLMPSYRMHLLSGSVSRRAAVIRQSMLQAKIAMLEEIMNYPSHPDLLAYTGNTFDYRTPILSAIEAIRQYPNVLPPSNTPPSKWCMSAATNPKDLHGLHQAIIRGIENRRVS